MEIIRELRKEIGMTQQELGEKLGLCYYNIGDWERGKCEPSAEMLVKLANIFGVSTDFLLGREESANAGRVSTPTLNAEEMELLRIYRNASRGGKNILLGNARNIEKNDEYLKKQRRA